jgi:hypothetical protein
MTDLMKQCHTLRSEILERERSLVLKKFPCSTCDRKSQCKLAMQTVERIHQTFLCVCGPFEEWQRQKDFISGQLIMIDRILSSTHSSDRE